MSRHSFSIPVPFSGGRISKEKAVFSLLCIRSITLIYFLQFFISVRKRAYWDKNTKKMERYYILGGILPAFIDAFL